MDYSAFWNTVPDIALFLLTVGMTAFVAIDFGRARTATLQAAAVHETTPTQEEALAA
jgi:hypothetical protein